MLEVYLLTIALIAPAHDNEPRKEATIAEGRHTNEEFCKLMVEAIEAQNHERMMARSPYFKATCVKINQSVTGSIVR